MTTYSLLTASLLLAFLPSDAPSLSKSGQETINAFLMESVESGKVPGLVALVVDREKVLYSGAFGKQNVAEDIDMRVDSIFRIASMTKPITSVAVMQLVELGKIGLDDPVSKYLPDLAKQEVFESFGESGELVTKPAKELTIRHLLTHTSGYGYGFCNHTLRRMQQETGKAARNLPLLHQPGTRWTYGMGTRILGDVVEVASGQKLDEYLDAHVLAPLGMIDTSFTIADDKLKRFVTLHQRTDGTLEEKPNPEPDRQAALGDGGLRSTADDYGKFLRMLLGQGSLGKIKVLSDGSVEMMTSNQIGKLVVELQPAANPSFAQPFPLGAGHDKFGLGFQITVARDEDTHARSIGSYSWGGIANTHFWVDPRKEIAAVLLMQVMPYYDKECIAVLRGFEQRVYENMK